MCKGIGFRTFDLWPGQRGFSEIERCPVCGPGQQQAYLDGICGLIGEMREWTFANTKPLTRKPYETLQELAQHPAWSVTLHGTYGTGKTRLLACTVNAGKAAGWTSVYMTTAELLDHLRSAYNPERKNLDFDGVWEKIVNASILALDELDRWNPTPWAQEKFFELVDLRYRRGRECLTVFATNASLDELPGYLASRIRDKRGYIFEMAGTDVRQVRR